jgi:high-affinity K+ transport system ATPase subunit B
MAIDNAEAVKFCNEKVRVAADKLAQAYYFAKQVQDEWYANNMGAIIPVDGGEVIDGAATDGRHVITGNDATNVIIRCGDLVTDMEANNSAKLNTVLAVAVNY